MRKEVSAYVHPLADLTWLYLESACELGYRATPFAENAALRFEGHRAFDELAATLLPGWISAPVPSPRAISAASRQKRIRDTLRQLSANDRHIIDAAYGLRNMASVPGGAALVSEYGQAATLAHQIIRKGGTKSEAARAAKILRGAHRRYIAARRKKHGRRYDKDLDSMSVEEKRALRVAEWKDQFNV